jgi:membrane protein required for colicin V production
MNVLDIVIAIPLAWGIYRGFKHGLIQELATLIGFVAGIYLGMHLSGLASEWLKVTFGWNTEYLPVVAFALVFILVLLGTWFLGKILSKTAEIIMLGWLNKLLGMIFGLTKWALIISFLFSILNGFTKNGSIVPEKLTKDSLFYKPLTALAPVIKDVKDKVTKDNI